MSNVVTVAQKFDISFRAVPEIKINTKPERITRVNALVTDIQSKTCDAIRNREIFDTAVEYYMNKKMYFKAAYIIFSANSGLRYCDIVSLRIRDIIDENNSIKESFAISERKTGVLRSVYLNEAMIKILKIVIKEKSLKSNDFIFQSDGNRTSYFAGFKYNKDGDIIDVVKSGEKIDEVGNQRMVCPISNTTASRWWDELHKFGAEGKLSSHSARKTFRFFVSVSGISPEEDNVLASQCLGHSSVKITEKYYCNVTEKMKHDAANTLNLGINGLRSSNI